MRHTVRGYGVEPFHKTANLLCGFSNLA